MEKQWQEMTSDEKMEWLRQEMTVLRRMIGQTDAGQSGLNDRIRKLEQAEIAKPSAAA